jgi:hypothetical protein
MPMPIAENSDRESISAASPTAMPSGGRKRYMAASTEAAVVASPGPKPPYRAAIRMAGKNCRLRPRRSDE